MLAKLFSTLIIVIRALHLAVKSSNIIQQNHFLRCVVGCTERKKWSHFNLKSWVTCGTKIQPGFRVIGEYKSQIDSMLIDSI